jgi:Ca2+-binding RTX toxin-like protein
MLFTQWLNELTDRVRRKRTSKFARKSRKAARSVPASSEVLENRVVPTITVDLTAGVLTVTGTAAANNLTVSSNGAGVYTLVSSSDVFNVAADDSNAGAGTNTGNGTGTLTIGDSQDDVTSVSIDLGAGNNDKLVILSLDDDAVTAAGGDNSGDTIQGPNATTAWTIDAANTVSISGQTVTFSGFRVAQGGSVSDTFDVTAAAALQLKGGDGDDTFNLGAALTGSISGEDGVDTLQGSQVDNVTLSSFSSSGLGVAGTENSISGGFSGIDSLIGNGTGASLTGLGANSTWTLDGSTGAAYSTASGALPINGFNNLNGGSAVDRFNVTGTVTFNINGGAGNDVITIGTAATHGQLIGTANGGAGNDTLDAQYSDLSATLFGGDGNDVVIGSQQADVLDGGLGNDLLEGLGDDDTLTGGAGNDILRGGAGTDRVVEINVSSAIVTDMKVTGGLGTDSLVAIEELDLTGTSANNLLDASAFTLGAVTLNGGDGSDTLAGGASFGDVINGKGGTVAEDAVVDTDVVRANVAGTVTLTDTALTSSSIIDTLSNIQAASLTGSASDDVIDASAFSGASTINGGAGNDSIDGAEGNNLLNGMNGNDTITGQGGNDSILGGAGNDELDGGVGDDRINGNDGDDTITGGADDDVITGDGGKDSIDGGAGNDKIDAGTGNDTVFGGDDNDSVSGGAGLDSIEGNGGNDTLNGNADNDRIEGGDGDDKIFGGAGNDVMLGGLDNDEINSQGGNDTMLGEEGNDKLNGGAGNELMFGGDGDDSMNGMGGNDTMLGDDGDDSMLGGAGNDLVLGGKGGDDYINGQSGNDSVSGGGGQDVVVDGSKERIDNFSHNALDDKPDSHDEYYDLFDPTLFEDLI